MKKVLIGMLATPVILIALVVWPYIYNYHIFSLARLMNSIEVGDGYAQVSKKFEEYQQRYESNHELQVVIKKDRLFIYHVNLFDDCQLTVNFDKTDKVESIEYIGD